MFGSDSYGSDPYGSAPEAQSPLNPEIETLIDKAVTEQKFRRLIDEGQHFRLVFGGAHRTRGQPQHSRTARFLLCCLLPKRLRDPIVGDLEEEFPGHVSEFGLQGAQVIYWCRLVSAVASLLPRSLWAAIAGWLVGKFGG
jgi:hypothetical protein